MPAQMHATQKINYFSGVTAVFFMIFMVAIAIRSEMPPQASFGDVPVGEFSAARAMHHLRHIAQEPHATGTEENAKVRTYLVEELMSLGLKPEVQSGLALNKPWEVAAMVHNVIVRIPGQASSQASRKALLLVAHYDSVSGGPGAADDGASVAAILETLRALKSAQPLQNDLICLFTDGEEAGLLGSKLFASESPWVKQVGLVLNFEYRGNSGPVLMFETSTGNGKLISGFANTASHPVANSLLYEVYKLMPNDTDFTSFKNAKIPGLNFAAIENPTSYHTQLDRPELLNQNTLQHEGDMMLSLVQHFGNTSLIDLTSSDRVYFDVPGLGLIHYPVSWVLPLCGIVVALLLAVVTVGIKKGEVRVGRILLGTLAFLLITVFMAVICQLLWKTVLSLHPDYRLLRDPYNSHWYLLALIALVIAFFVGIQAMLARWIRPIEFGLGAAICWIAILITTSFLLPGVSFVLTWPLMSILVTYGLIIGARGRELTINARMGILLVGTIPAVIIFAPLIRMLFIGLSPQMSLIIGLFASLLLGVMTPLLATLTRRFLLPALPLLAGIAFLAAGSLTAHFDIEHPRPTNVFYALDGTTGKALWLSSNTELDDWSKKIFLPTPVLRKVPEIFGEAPRAKLFWTSPTPSIDIKEPIIDVLQDTVVDNVRHVRVKIQSQRQAARVKVAIEGQEILSSRVQGVTYTNAPESSWKLAALGMPDNAVTIDFELKPGKPFQIRAFDETDGLTQFALPARPAEFITEMSGSLSDTVVAVQVKKFN